MGDEKAHVADLFSDAVGFVDDHALGGLAAEVGKFLQHLLRGAEVERGLVVGVLKALGGHEDGAVDGVLRVHEVDVAGGHHGDVQFIAKGEYFAVEVAQALFVLHRALAHEEGVVADGLYLQIVVEAGDALQCLCVLARQHGAEEFPGLAGAADDETLAVLLDQFARHARRAVEVVEVTFADEAVEVGHARLVLRQKDDVVGLRAGVGLEGVVDVVKARNVQAFQRFEQHQTGGTGVVYGAVGVFQRYVQMLADRAQLVVAQLLVGVAGESQCVQNGSVQLLAEALEGAAQKGHVERGVVRHQHRAFEEFCKFGKHFGKRRLPGEHGGVDARQLHHLFRDGAAGVDELGELPHFPAVFQTHGADLDDLVHVGVQARGLKIQHDKGGVFEGAAVAACDDLRGVLDKVALAAGNELDVLAAHRAEGLREGLHHAVVGDGDGGMPPCGGLRNQRLGRGAGVHGTHLRVQMQFHALSRGVVLAHGLGNGHHIRDHQHHLALVVVVAVIAAGLDPEAVLEGGAQLFRLFLDAAILALAAAAEEELAVDRALVVGHGEGDDLRLAVFCVAHFQRRHFALDGHAADVLGDLVHGGRLVVDDAAVSGLLRGGLLLARALLAHAARRFLGEAGFLGEALGADAREALLFAARHLDDRLCLDGEQVLEQGGKELVHAAGAHVGHALLAGGVDGENAVLQGEIRVAIEQEGHRAGAFMADEFDQKRRDRANVLLGALFERRIGEPEAHAHRRESGGERLMHALVFLARKEPVRAQVHAHLTRFFRDGDAPKRQGSGKFRALALDQFPPQFAHCSILCISASSISARSPCTARGGWPLTNSAPPSLPPAMPMSASFASPGPLTTQPITATRRGLRMCFVASRTLRASASTSMAVRPQVGQETTST